MNCTTELAVQILISLLKQHGVKRVIASPGSTNMALVASLQSDPFFEMYSCVDERSAAYLACGLAAETCEPVVISCTGATASRNYPPGLTEAYYRKLPVLAVTSTQPTCRVGHHIAQVIDRRSLSNDIANLSVELPVVKDDEDRWDCMVKVNKAILALKHRGGGPVHINLPTTYAHDYSVNELPEVRKIERVGPGDPLPAISAGRVALFMGAKIQCDALLTEQIDAFCETFNAAVFCDHTSAYKGKYRVLFALAGAQVELNKRALSPDLLIHLGEISGDYYTFGALGCGKVWRISEDGELRDTFKGLECVFEMSESQFFDAYNRKEACDLSYYQNCCSVLAELRGKLPDVPFSNIWLASQLAHLIPEGSVLHFGILNSLRAWNFYELPASIRSYCNVGGFGIDGALSTLIGASLASQARLYFGVLGDLAFFYDMNVLGNRHVQPNIRLLVVNNGKGTEFRQYGRVSDDFGDELDLFVSAGGHYGNQSRDLIKNYATGLGFNYYSASSKDEFNSVKEYFLNPVIGDKPLILEVFTNSSDESEALKRIQSIEHSLKRQAINKTKEFLGPRGVNIVRQITKG